MIETNKIYNEDCLDTMKGHPDACIDLVCSDPPYGYSFMGKDWDTFNEVVEPKGSYQKDKGFNKLPRNKPFAMYEAFLPLWKEALRILKPGGFAYIMAAPRQDVLCKQILALQDAGFEVGFSSIYWTYATGFPKAGNIGKKIDTRAGLKGKVIGTKKVVDVQSHGSVGDLYQKANKKPMKDEEIRERVSDKGKELDGSYGGFQPKPAVEVIIVAMKPLSEKTYVDQALKNGKGVTWLDDCRIPFNKNEELGDVNRFDGLKPYPANKGWNNNDLEQTPFDVSKGRFPANLLVSDGVVDDGDEYKTGDITKDIEEKKQSPSLGSFGQFTSRHTGDSGSFSRYFDLDKWWDERIKELPKKVQKSYPFLIVPKAAKSEKNDGTDNNHPTVKPVKLMSYLITLGSRPDDIIYDPFAGSGTTLIAAEITRRKWIGSEISKEYHKIAEERIKRELHQFKLF